MAKVELRKKRYEARHAPYAKPTQPPAGVTLNINPSLGQALAKANEAAKVEQPLTPAATSTPIAPSAPKFKLR